MMMEYGPEIQISYASIPQNVKNIMGDTSKYTVNFDDGSPPPQDKNKKVCNKLKSPRWRINHGKRLR